MQKYMDYNTSSQAYQTELKGISLLILKEFLKRILQSNVESMSKKNHSKSNRFF